MLCPSVNRLTYSTTSRNRYRKKMTPTRNSRWSVPVTMCFAPEIHEGGGRRAVHALDERCVLRVHGVAGGGLGKHERRQQERGDKGEAQKTAHAVKHTVQRPYMQRAGLRLVAPGPREW